MPYFAVYDATTGALVSSGSVVVDPLPLGHRAKDVGSNPGDQLWDKATLSFVARPAPVLASLMSAIQADADFLSFNATNRTKIINIIRRAADRVGAEPDRQVPVGS